jgi:hypothetical protein
VKKNYGIQTPLWQKRTRAETRQTSQQGDAHSRAPSSNVGRAAGQYNTDKYKRTIMLNLMPVSFISHSIDPQYAIRQRYFCQESEGPPGHSPGFNLETFDSMRIYAYH